ncbi:MAG: hypothetical protein HFI40_01880 [Lachnospiraceae bacterium]|jgi:hypothetical protein|nr:hypothetical protein [Lachnospiraceae bacterium]MCX4315104.1 hypothetical protein [Lachnospiraceae bacterium]
MELRETDTIRRRGEMMGEEVYKTMKHAGVLNLVLGICLIAGAVAMGVTMIVTAVRLLTKKSSLTF